MVALIDTNVILTDLHTKIIIIHFAVEDAYDRNCGM